jgi:hypothetical protein
MLMPISQYISNLSHHRDGPKDDINDISDPHSGLLLYIPLHRLFGAGEKTFFEGLFLPSLFQISIN